MDPWLEDPAVWPNLHHLLISQTNAQLRPQLRPRGYLVTIGERVWVTEPGRGIYPDVFLVERPAARPAGDGGVAVLEADQPVRVKVPGAEVREPYLEILDVHDEHVVTCIEFLSPANKASGPSRDLYLKKQREVLSSPANLVEVDLLRSGRHTVAIAEHLLDPAWSWDYLVSIARTTMPDEYEVYPIALPSRLPRIAIPLNAGDADGVLDLQRVLDQAYDSGPFADRIDYSQPPFGKLSDEMLAWCNSVLARETKP
jgi:hypothetical protein